MILLAINTIAIANANAQDSITPVNYNIGFTYLFTPWDQQRVGIWNNIKTITVIETFGIYIEYKESFNRKTEFYYFDTFDVFHEYKTKDVNGNIKYNLILSNGLDPRKDYANNKKGYLIISNYGKELLLYRGFIGEENKGGVFKVDLINPEFLDMDVLNIE